MFCGVFGPFNISFRLDSEESQKVGKREKTWVVLGTDPGTSIWVWHGDCTRLYDKALSTLTL